MQKSQKQFIRMIASLQSDGSFRMQEGGGQKNDAPWEHTALIEGQLSVDVFVTDKKIIMVAPMAGADTAAITVTLHDDVLTIRGVRELPLSMHDVRHITHQECFWGPFSRTIVLPHPVLSHKVQAEYTNGTLVVELTKAHIESKIPVHISDE